MRAAALAPVASRRQRTATFLFTDIAGSTEMLTSLGEDTWLRALRDHNYVVQDVVDTFGGNALKFLGDGWMVAFASPRDAVDSAIIIERTLTRNPSPDGFRVRIGVHLGSATEEGEEFVGKDVVIASRITQAAAPGEILVSADVVDALGPLTDGDRFDGGRIAHLKGLGHHLVFGVKW